MISLLDSTKKAQDQIGDVFGQFEKMINKLNDSINTLQTRIKENDEKVAKLYQDNTVYTLDVNKADALKAKLSALLSGN